MLALAASFFAVALLYAMVGFGGGSSYVALLATASVPFLLIPKIGLVCNLLVVTGGGYLYYRRGYFSSKLTIPFVLASMPMSFLGGLFPITEKTFLTLLSLSLLLAAARLLFIRPAAVLQTHTPPLKISIPAGAGLGLLSGMVGIGGGIFLSPILLMCRWGKPKEIAATASAFIFLNSIAGLAGQLIKDPSAISQLPAYSYLFIAVIVGGIAGAHIGTHHKVEQHWIKNATAVLILFIGVKLLLKVLHSPTF